MTLITRKTIHQEAQMQRREVRQLRELLECKVRQEIERNNADAGYIPERKEPATLHIVRPPGN
jgi:hypothetical protein